jgi:hypothetical protein
LGHTKLSCYFETFDKCNSPHDIQNYFIFTSVRNPFERVLSAFKYLKKGGINASDARTRDEYQMQRMSFSAFVFKNLHKTIEDSCVHFVPQFEFISPHFDKLSFIARFETLQNDFNIVCDKIGIPRQELPHKNKTQHKHYTEYYNDETKQIVAEKYARDIEQFGYQFDKP